MDADGRILDLGQVADGQREVGQQTEAGDGRDQQVRSTGIDTYSIMGIYRRHGESGGSSRRLDWPMTSIRAAAQNNPLGR